MRVVAPGWEGVSGRLAGFEAVRALPAAQVVERLRRAGVARRAGGTDALADALERLAGFAGVSGCVVCDAAEHDSAAAGVTWLAGVASDAILEGLAIAAYAARAATGVVFVAGGSVEALRPLASARDELVAWLAARPPSEEGGAAEPGLHVEVVEGLPALVMSQDTALVAALEGRRPMPSPEWGPSRELELWGLPCAVVDAEILACLPGLFAPGAEGSGGLAAPGADSPDTGRPEVRLFTLTGRVARPGVFALPTHATLADLVAAAGGAAGGGGDWARYRWGVRPAPGCPPPCSIVPSTTPG